MTSWQMEAAEDKIRQRTSKKHLSTMSMERDIRQARIRDWEPQLRTAPARGELTAIAEMAQAVPVIPLDVIRVAGKQAIQAES